MRATSRAQAGGTLNLPESAYAETYGIPGGIACDCALGSTFCKRSQRVNGVVSSVQSLELQELVFLQWLLKKLSTLFCDLDWLHAGIVRLYPPRPIILSCLLDQFTSTLL